MTLGAEESGVGTDEDSPGGMRAYDSSRAVFAAFLAPASHRRVFYNNCASVGMFSYSTLFEVPCLVIRVYFFQGLSRVDEPSFSSSFGRIYKINIINRQPVNCYHQNILHCFLLYCAPLFRL